MKYLRFLKIILVNLLILACLSFSTTKGSKGIDFIDGNFSDALALSKKTNKPVFVDVYAKWCGPCKQLKRTSFKDQAAGDYFNKNFINIGIDGETEEGRAIRNLYGVTSYPTLLIVNSDGKLLTKAEGFMKPYILINFGKRIVF